MVTPFNHFDQMALPRGSSRPSVTPVSSSPFIGPSPKSMLPALFSSPLAATKRLQYGSAARTAPVSPVMTKWRAHGAVGHVEDAPVLLEEAAEDAAPPEPLDPDASPGTSTFALQPSVTAAVTTRAKSFMRGTPSKNAQGAAYSGLKAARERAEREQADQEQRR
jgi:hypothetical protein